MAFQDSLVGIAVLAYGGIMKRTTDGGLTWEEGASGITQWFQSLACSRGNIFLAGGTGGSVFGDYCDTGIVLRSTDAGITWTSVLFDTSDFWLNPPHGEIKEISMPSDSTWYSLETCPANLFGYSHIYRTTDAGLSWHHRSSVAEYMDTVYSGLSVASESLGILVGMRGKVRTTADGWLTSTPRNSGITTNLIAVDLHEDSVAIAVGWNGVIIRSTDAGNSWTQVNSGTTDYLWDVKFIDSRRGFIIGSGTLLYTTDRGATWSAESTGVSSGLSMISIPDPHHVWVAGPSSTLLARNMFGRIILPESTMNFGSLYLDSSRTDSIVVGNDGTDSLYLTCTTDNPDFFALDTIAVIASGDTSVIRVRFNPTLAGHRSGNLVLSYNGAPSPDTVRLQGHGLEWGSTSFAAHAGWNLISLPREVPADSVSLLFPSATSGAYRFDPDTGYVAAPRLEPGAGYWLKFSTADTVSLTGFTTAADTVEVRAGWNLIGAVSLPVAAGSIVQSPPGIIVSDFFGYDRAYYIANPQVLMPGRGYWVKVNADGILYLYGQ